MSDRFEDEPRPRMPTEGVRILGAEEAQAALGGTRSARRRARAGSTTQPTTRTSSKLNLTPGALAPRPDRFPDEGPTWSAPPTHGPTCW